MQIVFTKCPLWIIKAQIHLPVNRDQRDIFLRKINALKCVTQEIFYNIICLNYNIQHFFKSPTGVKKGQLFLGVFYLYFPVSKIFHEPNMNIKWHIQILWIYLIVIFSLCFYSYILIYTFEICGLQIIEFLCCMQHLFC